MKYRLIKEYPGSPKLGCILELKEDHNYYPINQPGGWFSEKSHLIPFPEFWEPVVEKDYEILSFKNIDNNLIYDKYQEIYRNETSTRLIGYCLEFYKIHSIKRLSDGEIFTIGDLVGTPGSIYPLKEFKIIDSENTIAAHYYKDKTGGSGHYNHRLKNLKKAKQPLFTTEDGIDIFEGDEFYYVKFTQVNHSVGKPFQIIRGNRTTFIYEPQYEKYFSTKEKAEEYILLSKPCLSINDIKNFINTCRKKGINFKSCEKELEFVFNLEKLVKQKLNK